ncbi:MAG: hypothetical protein AB9903_18990 [Vulcanimicrobiota bacterium]
MSVENNGKKHLLQDDSSLKQVMMEAEKSVQEKKGILEETLPIRSFLKKKSTFDDPEFLSTVEVQEEKKSPLQSLVIFLVAGILLTVVIIMAWRFNDSLGTVGGHKTGNTITYDGKPLQAQVTAKKASAPVIPGGDNEAVMIPNKRPVVNQTVINDPEGSTPQENTENDPVEQRKKLKVDTSIVPPDFNLVKTENDGTHVYVDTKSEIYTLIPGENKLHKIDRRHAP